MDKIDEVLKAYGLQQKSYHISTVNQGHINESYSLLSKDSNLRNYFLQKINEIPFSSAADVMYNVSSTIDCQRKNPHTKLDSLNLIKTKNNNTSFIDNQKDTWRLFYYLDNFSTVSSTDKEDNMYRMGSAYSAFIHQVNRCNSFHPIETIRHFHKLSKRIFSLQNSIKNDSFSRKHNCTDLLHIVEDLADEMLRMEYAIETNKLPSRICHNDTKANNVMLHNSEDKACVIDLDTVMNGSLLYDYGDSVRSIISIQAEDSQDLIDLQWVKQRAFHRGFMENLADTMTEAENHYLPISVVYMPFIMGVRFLTDYLSGDIYFNIHHESQNLDRASNQLRLSKLLYKHSNMIK